MADARGRCQQRLSPHHPRGACGCLICGEDDHRWTCCGKSYLSAGCTNGEDLIGARATVVDTGKQYTTSTNLAKQLGVTSRWKKYNSCNGGDECTIIAQCKNKSNNDSSCVAIQLDRVADCIVLIGLKGLRINELAPRAEPPTRRPARALPPAEPTQRAR